MKYKKWECIVCGLIYDEELGWPDDGIEPELMGRCSRRLVMSRGVSVKKILI